MRPQQTVPKRSSATILIKSSVIASCIFSVFLLSYFYRSRRPLIQQENFLGSRNCGANCKLSLSNWAKSNATPLGMVGFAEVAEVDIRDSQFYLAEQIIKFNVTASTALDVGAGIGRVSKEVLLPIFDKVDAVDGTKKFVEAYPSYVGSKLQNKLGQQYWSPLEDYQPKLAAYDLIWIQWVFMYMNDDDVISFLRISKEALKADGIIILKENMADDTRDHVNPDDKSIARCSKTFLRLFDQADLRISDKMRQTDFPEYLYAPIFFTLTKTG